MIKAVLLDFDGVIANVNINKVLCNSIPYLKYHRFPIKRVLKEYFYNNPQNKALDLGLITAEIVREKLRRKLWNGTKENWMKWWSIVENAYEILPEMKDWLDELRVEYPLAMITDNHSGFNQWLKGRYDIQRYFKVIINSANVGAKKPKKLLFDLAAKRLSVRLCECVFIDDDKKSTDGAKILGIHSIHFQSVPQAKKAFHNLKIKISEE